MWGLLQWGKPVTNQKEAKCSSFKCLTVWGVEPLVTHQTSWLKGKCDVGESQAQYNSV